MMKYISRRELTNPSLWKTLEHEKELAITSKDEPIAILSAVTASSMEATLAALRQARAELAVSEMQHRACETGLDGWSLEQVNAEINDARRHRA